MPCSLRAYRIKPMPRAVIKPPAIKAGVMGSPSKTILAITATTVVIKPDDDTM